MALGQQGFSITKGDFKDWFIKPVALRKANRLLRNGEELQRKKVTEGRGKIVFSVGG